MIIEQSLLVQKILEPGDKAILSINKFNKDYFVKNLLVKGGMAIEINSASSHEN
ncbi:hypothetical protein EV10_0496 [Prochlorococcus marinus str. SS51]|uniref:Uncharacterized protein n=1 Tax=Prochlorococcus marinus (strain SARG / CCMP1375 / SS120) TaxID=167539 RepID=Q7VB76_PROMA|nr:Predicted protein [Prochlorococcus marinus subsp. marinus str. CCMP1375]KGG14073.1 hypothetical protein EV04_0558 [Prochlorococcus marinus str. LG]KGG20758.1 hypothetical protein EV08_0962 [Prochlorococcus marinus str. SS2]KGG25159.1 hypothetical protein EV09_0053 [Prochlorococcus marinus str. SS35]KGG33289.1 hypothetical protein EV10_0496 [Prochlorococcus marinus str. SS51]